MKIFEHLQHIAANSEFAEPISDQEATQIREEYPEIPDSYIRILTEAGAGDLEEFQLYSGPVPPEDIYPQPTENLKAVVLIGDDFQGYCFGFDVEGEYRLVEIDPRGRLNRVIDLPLEKFLEEFFGQGD